MKVFVGTLVHTPDRGAIQILNSHAVGVDDTGKITFVKPSFEYKPSEDDTITELRGEQFIVPGFVDAHIHAPQFPNCGIFGNSTLLDWLHKYTFSLESQYSSVDLATTVYTRLIERQLSNGTTTSSYFGTVHVPSTVRLAEICLEKGQRALVGRVCMERFCPESLQDGSLESDMDFIKRVQKLDPIGADVKPVITPRFAPSCEYSTLMALGDLSRSLDLPVQTHVAENVKEIEWVNELFPEAANYTDVYEQTNLLKHDTVLAHGVHLTEDELKLIRKRNAGIVHCPNSNASIASGIAQVKRHLDAGLKIGLGSDVSGGSTTSILKNMRLALMMSRLLSERENGSMTPILSVEDGLFLATLGGAEVVNMAERIGTFEVGKRFDAQLIDVEAKDSPIDLFDFGLPTEPKERALDILQKWVYVGDDRNTTKVWVNGKLVHQRVQ